METVEGPWEVYGIECRVQQNSEREWEVTFDYSGIVDMWYTYDEETPVRAAMSTWFRRGVHN